MVCFNPHNCSPIDPFLNRPTSFDYVSANQGWTSPGGHPVEVILRGARPGTPMAAMIHDQLDPDFVEQIDTPADVARHWSYLIAAKPKPDFVKVFLIYSEDYARRRADSHYEGSRGMDPALVPTIVRTAHQAGLKVSAHVFTAADFRNALNDGVDGIAHLPGGPSTDPTPFLITDADGRRTAGSPRSSAIRGGCSCLSAAPRRCCCGLLAPGGASASR